MILFKPQAQVFQEDTGETVEHYLHSVTYFGNSGYENDGYEDLPTSPDSEGFLNVNLKVKVVESGLPVLEYITPIVHIVPLDQIPVSDYPIRVTVTENGRLVGSTIIIDIDVKEGSRPVGENE